MTNNRDSFKKYCKDVLDLQLTRYQLDLYDAIQKYGEDDSIQIIGFQRATGKSTLYEAYKKFKKSLKSKNA